MRRQAVRLLQTLLLLATLMALPALAHKPSDSYLRLSVAEDGHIEGQWDIALRDLEVAIGLDADGDGAITWTELRARHEEIAAYALARLTLARGDKPCTIKPGAQQVDEHTDGSYTVLPLRLACEGAGSTLRVAYRLFADLDPQHRGLLSLASASGTRSAVLDPLAEAVSFELDTISHAAQLRSFVGEGVWHIWIGFDHILFLLSLLLPAVLVWSAPRWQPVQRLRAASIDVLKIVTAFTIAHSITLSLAALGLIELPSALVESTIAASVVLAALNNIYPIFYGRRWWVAFGFGLVHGFGFASVLADLGLPQNALLLALLGFNVGVELGQLAIVAAFLPLAYALRGTAFYRSVLLKGGSAVIALLAAVWFVERAFGLQILKL